MYVCIQERMCEGREREEEEEWFFFCFFFLYREFGTRRCVVAYALAFAYENRAEVLSGRLFSSFLIVRIVAVGGGEPALRIRRVGF